MNKKYLNFLLIVICLGIISICFYNYQIIAPSVIECATIFITRVFPFLFMMMILNNLLVSLNFPYYICKLTHNPYIYIFIMSSLSGSPINAVIIKNLLDKKMISEIQASKTLCFTTVNNPLFLYNYINLIFNSPAHILKIFLIIYFGNIFLLLLMVIRDSHKIKLIPTKINIKKELTTSITNTINNLLNIFATITFFKLICDLLIKNNSILSVLFKGLIEITQGLNLLTQVNLKNKIKELLIVVILSFSGFSIHIQISNILSCYNINYKYFYLSRIVLCLFGIIVVLST